MRNLLILAFALAAAAPALPVRAYDDVPRHERAETPKDFKHWADGRVKKLQSEIKTTGKDIDGYNESTRRSAEGKLDGLKERLSKVEGRLQEVGTKDTKSSWSDRKEIRDELKDIGKDFGSLRKDLNRKR